MQLNLLKNVPPECQLHIRAIVDNAAIEEAKAPLLELEMRTMRDHVADALVKHHVGKVVGKYSTALSLDVLVFSPDEFAGIVRRAANHLTGMVPFYGA